MIVEEAYRQFASMVIASTGGAGTSPRTAAIITKTLTDLHARLKTDPAYLEEFIRRVRRPDPKSPGIAES